MTRPLIGFVTAPRGDLALRLLMTAIIGLSGGAPRHLRAAPKDGEPRLDGLILMGGLDIHPSRYDASIEVESRFDPERDALEIAWLQHARDHGAPVMGICRGLQMLNVFHGGDLHQRLDPEITRDWPNGPLGYALFRKPVTVEPDTFLSQIFAPQDCVSVNSLHRRAVRTVAPGFRTSARDAHGGIQAIEAEEAPLRLGVQFHPELLFYRRDMRRLFRLFINDCS